MSYAEDKGLTMDIYKKMKSEGKSDNEIIEKFGISYGILYDWKKDNGLVKPKTTLSDKGLTIEKYKDLKETSVMDSEIAEKYDVAEHTLYKWKRKNGLITENKFSDDLSSLTTEKYKEYKRQQIKDKEIAHKFNVSESRLYKWKVENGLNKKIEKRKIDYKLTPDMYKKMKDQNISDAEISRKCDCCLSSLHLWKKRNGISGLKRIASVSKMGEFTIEEYNIYRKQDLKDTEIAEKIGVLPTTLANWKRRVGIQQSYRGINGKITPGEYIKFKTEMNMTDREIAEKIKVSNATLIAWKREHNLSEYRLPTKIGRDLNITKEEYEAYREEGFTNTDIAELIVECSVNQLYALRKKWESEDGGAAS